MAAGADAPDTTQFRPRYGIALVVGMNIGMNIVNPMGGPFGEEPSFRGFAVPMLQTHRAPLVAAAILAVLVTGWHAPLFFINAFGLEPIEALTTVAVTFWYVWLFNQAAGSACFLVTGEVQRILGTEIHTQQAKDLSSCDVSAKKEFIDGPGLTLTVSRTTTWFGDAPRHASDVVNAIKGATATPVPGLGDEAYQVSKTQLTIRVSNVVLNFASNGRLLLASDERLDEQMREVGAGAVRRLTHP